MIYFPMKHGKDPGKICYAYTNKDFTDLETKPNQLFFSPDNAACIDGDLVKKDNRYYLFFKTEDRSRAVKSPCPITWRTVINAEQRLCATDGKSGRGRRYVQIE